MPKKLRRLPPALFVASNEISCGFAVTAGFSIELFYIPCSHPRTPPHSLFFSLRPRPVNGQPSTPSLPLSENRLKTMNTQRNLRRTVLPNGLIVLTERMEYVRSV